MTHSFTMMADVPHRYQYLKEVALLDSQSTVDIFCNERYLRNIKKVSDTMYLATNGGVLKCTKQGLLPGYGMVWFDERAITNIISVSKARRKGNYKIT